MQSISEKDFEKAVIKGEKPALVDFYAEWCGPCKMLKPVLTEISEQREDIDFYAVDIDSAGELTSKFGIMNVPTVMLFKDGNLVNKFIGAQSKDAVMEFIDSSLK